MEKVEVSCPFYALCLILDMEALAGESRVTHAITWP